MEFGTKIVKVILESHVERVGQICTDCLGGGRMVMAKSLFTIVLAVWGGKLRGEFTNLCRFFWNLLRISVRRRTLNVELVLALRALLRGTLASETHTHGKKKHTEKKKTQAQYQAHRHSVKSGSGHALGTALGAANRGNPASVFGNFPI